jgi:hypothetical protein
MATTLIKPVGQRDQVIGEGQKLADRRVGSIRVDRDPMLATTHIDAGTIMMDDLKAFLVLARHDNSSQD